MRIASSLTGLATILILIGGCAATATERPLDNPTTAARALLPDKLREAGTLRVGADPIFEPIVYKENGKLVGFDMELAAALADRLGLRLEAVETPWEKLRAEVSAGRLELVMSSMTDTAKRQQEVNFVDYLNVGSSIVVGGATGVKTLADLCGHRVAVIPTSIYQDLAKSQAAQCPSTKPLRIVVDGESEAAVRAGRADAFLHDYPVAVAAAKKGAGLTVVGDQIEAAPYGIAVAKDQTGLLKAVQAALYDLFRDGTYDKLVQKWGITEGSLKTGAINGGA